MPNLAIRLARHLHIIGNSPIRRRSSTPSLPKKAFDGLTRVGKGVTQTAAKLPQAFSAQVHEKKLSDDELEKLTPLGLRKFVEQQGVQLEQLNLKLLKEAANTLGDESYANVENPNIYALDDPRRWKADPEFNLALVNLTNLIKASRNPNVNKTELAKLEKLNDILTAIDQLYINYQANFEKLKGEEEDKSKASDPAGYHAGRTACKAYDCLLLLLDKGANEEGDLVIDDLSKKKKQRPRALGLPHSPAMAINLSENLAKLVEEHQIIGPPDQAPESLLEELRRHAKIWSELLTRENLKAGQLDTESIAKYEKFYEFLHKVEQAINGNQERSPK